MTRVLVVDDEPGIRETLAITLRASGYDIETAADGEEALLTAAARTPDLVVLDLGLPDLDGVQVIAQLRATSQAPILVLSGRRDSADKVDALDAGADDYVTKPFGMDELLARLRAMSRRAAAEPVDPIRFGSVEIDVAAKRITVTHDDNHREEHRRRPSGGSSKHSSTHPAGSSAKPTCSAESGTRRRNRTRQPAPLRRATPPQARERPSPPQALPHRARFRVPLPAMSPGKRLLEPVVAGPGRFLL